MLRLYQVSHADGEFLRHHLARIQGHVFQGLVKLSNGPGNYVSIIRLLFLSLRSTSRFINIHYYDCYFVSFAWCIHIYMWLKQR